MSLVLKSQSLSAREMSVAKLLVVVTLQSAKYFPVTPFKSG